jgi:conjugal transfer pilin signal peptidase TrbI
VPAARWAKARRLRNYLGLVLLVGLVWGHALLWVAQHYRVAGNETASLPDRFFVLALDGSGIRHAPFVRGCLVAFHVADTVRHYPPGLVFIKRLVGLPGDAITWQGDTVYVAGAMVGAAQPRNRFGEALPRTPPGVIPPGHYFVATPHPDSYDSRYAEVGLVSDRQVAGDVLW